MTATAIAAGQGDLSDREFIQILQDQIKETQQALDSALKDVKPSLSRSSARMLELLQRPAAVHCEAADRAESHRQHLKVATMSPHSLPAAPIPATVRATTPVKSKKRGHDFSSTSTDCPDPPQAKKRKIAPTSTKGKRKS